MTDAAQRKELIDRLYEATAKHFRDIRVTEIQKMEDRRTGGSAKFATADLAADAWDALELTDLTPLAEWVQANATGECWCMVDVPAVTKTVSKRVMTKPASTREIEEPAQYQTVSKKVLVEPSHEDRSPIPAETENVSRKELVTPSRVDWVHIDCQAKEPAEPAPKVKRMREPGINGWYTFQSR